MKPTEFWYWRMMSKTTHRVQRSPCRYCEADAMARDPNAVRVPGTCVIIDVAETDDERAARAHSNRFGARS